MYICNMYHQLRVPCSITIPNLGYLYATWKQQVVKEKQYMVADVNKFIENKMSNIFEN